MKTAWPGWRPGADADPEALIKEARRRQHRRYLMVGLVIVVLLAGAAGITAGVTGLSGHGPGRQGPRGLPSPRDEGTSSSAASARSAMPRFFADDLTFSEGNGSLEVRASANGRLVAQEEDMAGVYGLAATGDDSFVIALQAGDGCTARLYQVRLGGQGRPGGLSPVGPDLHGLVWSLASDAGGGVIGYAVSGCAKGDSGYIGIVDTRTGRSRQWSDVGVGGESAGNVATSGSLSISASGELLAFTGWNVAADGRFTSQVVRVLPTTAAAGTVAERSHVVLSRPVSQPELTAVSLSPSGDLFYLSTESGRTTTVAEYRTSTGSFVEYLARLKGTPAPMQSSMALDTSGQFLLVPYSLSQASHPMLKVAMIGITTRAVTTVMIQLPRTAGMDQETGMDAAW
jgi:hypothetical protein